MQQLKDQVSADQEQGLTIEQPAQPRLLTPDEMKAVAGGDGKGGRYDAPGA